MEEAQHVAGDVLQPDAFCQLFGNIGLHLLDDFEGRAILGGGAEDPAVGLMQDPRRMVGGAAQHHPVDVGQLGRGRGDCLDAAVDDDGEFRMVMFQPVDALIVERRNLAVFLRRQTLEPGLAGMDDESAATRLHHRDDEAGEVFLVILIVDADPALHRDRQLDRFAHGAHAVAHQFRLGHQAGAETAHLHPVRRAADIEIDLGIAEILAPLRGLGQECRIAAANLQCHRLLAVLKAQKPLAVAMADRLRRNHFRVKKSMRRELTVEDAAVPVGPIHHGRNGKAVAGRCHDGAHVAADGRNRKCALPALALSRQKPGGAGSYLARAPLAASNTKRRSLAKDTPMFSPLAPVKSFAALTVSMSLPVLTVTSVWSPISSTA